MPNRLTIKELAIVYAVIVALRVLVGVFTGFAAPSAWAWVFIWVLPVVAIAAAYTYVRVSENWVAPLYFACLGAATAILTGLGVFSWAPQWWYLTFVGMAAAVFIPAFIEFVVLRIAENHPLGAVMRVTYYESLLQPFTLIVMGTALFAIFVAAFVPFYTISEDHKMYRDIASQFVSLAALIIMVYAAAKVIDEEIENRTMLTLMSKPIARWQVVVGKYLGVVLVVFVVIAVLGTSSAIFSYLRYFDDLRVDFSVASSVGEVQGLFWANQKAMLGFIPLFTLQFFMMATLAAVAVAISTRYGLALNITAIAVLYVGANMTRFVGDLGMREPLQSLATYGSYLLPFLANFDLSQRLIYADPPFRIGNEPLELSSVTYGAIWQYVGLTGVYTLFYVGAALSLATALFRTRELT